MGVNVDVKITVTMTAILQIPHDSRYSYKKNSPTQNNFNPLVKLYKEMLANPLKDVDKVSATASI